MKFCQPHWDMCRKAIDDRSMSHLVAKSSEAAVETMQKEIEGTNDVKADFDPLMSMHWHWTNGALKNGGLYLMSQDPSGKNDGHYCPVCEFESHYTEFKCEEEICKVADQMLVWCREQGLVGKPQ